MPTKEEKTTIKIYPHDKGRERAMLLVLL